MLGDIKGLMSLHVELNKWEEAFMLAKQNKDLEGMIYLPYADWLSANDRFDEA
jgi:intraflagellar transport protein 122